MEIDKEKLEFDKCGRYFNQIERLEKMIGVLFMNSGRHNGRNLYPGAAADPEEACSEVF